MAAGFLGGEVELNGTTYVTVGGAPASGKQRQILSGLAVNRDTIEHTFEARKVGGAQTVDFDKVTVPSGRAMQLVDQCIVLDAPGETYEVRLSEPMATTQPVVDVAIFEVP